MAAVSCHHSRMSAPVCSWHFLSRSRLVALDATFRQRQVSRKFARLAGSGNPITLVMWSPAVGNACWEDHQAEDARWDSASAEQQSSSAADVFRAFSAVIDRPQTRDDATAPGIKVVAMTLGMKVVLSAE